jgi:hypothetical protein
MSKKRGKIPSLISGSSGNPTVAIAKRLRPCSRCEHQILKGEKCFEVPIPGQGFSNKRTFCLECFGEVIEQSRNDLERLDQEWMRLQPS